MRLATNILVEALNDMLNSGYTGEEIMRESGISNISRLLHGQIKNPDRKTWVRLHETYPDRIPPPTMIDGSIIYKGVNTAHAQTINQSASDMHITNAGQMLSVDHQMLINLLLEKDKDNSYCRKMIMELLQK